jgi:hypothetical protein
VSDPPFCIRITFQVMTVSRQSTRRHHAIGAFFKGQQNLQDIQFTGAGHQHHFDLRGILHPQPAGKVCGCVSTVFAAKGNDLVVIYTFQNIILIFMLP